VYAEPETWINGINATIVTRPFKHGPHRNWMQTIRDLVNHNQQAKWVAIFQDDALFCKDTRKFLDEMPWPGEKTGVVSLYCPDDTAYETEGFVGCKKINVTELNGAVAMVFPMSVAKRIADGVEGDIWDGHMKQTIEDPVKRAAIDSFIGRQLGIWELDAYVYDPGLVQHIGKTSTIHSGLSDESVRGGSGRSYRKSLRWPGENVSPFDTFEDNRPKHPIDVVIPGVDSLDLTTKCLEHLAKSEGVDLHVIYVDNGSGPGVLEKVEAKAAELELMFTGIRNPENTGFTMATNQGLSLATGDVLLLNNDCFVEPGTIATLRRHLHADEKMAAVGPLTDDAGRQSVVAHNSLASQRGAEKTSKRDALAFFCTLIKKSAIGNVGILSGDHVYRNLGSDDEWCRRARKIGWMIGLALNAFAEHKHKATFKRLGIDRAGESRDAMAALRGELKSPLFRVSNHTPPPRTLSSNKLTRNLIYYIYPLANNGMWKWNVENLIRRIDQFNGKRFIGIAMDDKCSPLDEVMAAFDGEIPKENFIVKENSHSLGEVNLFSSLLEKVESLDENEITFYGHAKGVACVGDRKNWGDAMYRTCLDYPEIVDHSLQENLITGTFKKHGGFTTMIIPPEEDWHYSGTFFWFRNKAVFSRKWGNVGQFFGGVECWPGKMFRNNESGCLFYECDFRTLLQDLDLWLKETTPALEKWKNNHVSWLVDSHAPSIR